MDLLLGFRAAKELDMVETVVLLKGLCRHRGIKLIVEFSCVLFRGEHINGWEIFALFNIVENGKLSDGSTVSTVQIVFEECWAARQEKRPLLDIGCKVFCYRHNGELEEITV